MGAPSGDNSGTTIGQASWWIMGQESCAQGKKVTRSARGLWRSTRRCVMYAQASVVGVLLRGFGAPRTHALPNGLVFAVMFGLLLVASLLTAWNRWDEGSPRHRLDDIDGSAGLGFVAVGASIVATVVLVALWLGSWVPADWAWPIVVGLLLIVGLPGMYCTLVGLMVASHGLVADKDNSRSLGVILNALPLLAVCVRCVVVGVP